MPQSTTATSDTMTSNDLRRALGEEHEALDALFADAVDAFDTNNPPWAAHSFGELEHHLEAHLRMEEDHIFPALARFAPAEVHVLEDEHARIRSQLASLAIAVDLHTARADAIRALVATLRAHALREDTLAYRWADANLSTPERQTLEARIRQRLAKLRAHASGL